jgi:hypothetical protein
MKKLFLPLFLAALVLAWAGCQSNAGARGTVVVKYDHPEKFTDFKSERSAPTSQVYLDGLRRHLEIWAGQSVPVGQTLTLTFTDIDMAGELRTANGETRIIKPSYPLRMKFTWVITDAAGAVVKEGSENLMNDFTTKQIGYDPSDPLYHEKAQMDEWIRRNLR